VAALERGWFDAGLLIDNPVDAVQGWAWSFCAETGAMRPGRVPRPGGTPIGLFEWHKRLLKDLRNLVGSGVIPDTIVPEGAHILDLWEETLEDLIRADLPRLARRLDWALKWSILSEVVSSPGDLDDQQLRLLDQYYGHIDDRVGLFWPFWKQGLVDKVIDASAVRRFLTAGDPRTRSGLRGELVRRLKPWIDTMDWSYVELSREGQRAWWQPSERRRVALADPSEESGPRIEQLRSLVPEDSQLLELLTATETEESITRTSRSGLSKYPLAPYPLFPETQQSDNPRSSSDDDHRTFPSAN
ncbi:MAG TPA: proteasome accessory factor PafA2 family protein, partial [Isosphaeraceae bacterium]|nr:proteasome accessory factor PafA2 family protein [Isosphaeraceae bacterium]